MPIPTQVYRNPFGELILKKDCAAFTVDTENTSSLASLDDYYAATNHEAILKEGQIIELQEGFFKVGKVLSPEAVSRNKEVCKDRNIVTGYFHNSVWHY